MSILLHVIGLFLVICGIIGGAILIGGIDWHGYKMAKLAYSSVVANPYTQLSSLIIQSKTLTQLSLGIATILSGLISGIFFSSIGTIIDLLKKIADQQKSGS